MKKMKSLILFIKNIFPFGNSLIVKSDALAQYQPMLYNFIEKLRIGTLEPYTFNNGFGSPTIFNYLYYISSPLNLLSIFFKSPEGMYTFICLLKICISALTMTYYVKKKTDNNFLSTIMCIGYSFCGWILTYYNFSLWLDIFMVFPLFQYSLEQLMEKGKCKLCGKTGATEKHHKKSKGSGGNDTEENLIEVCRICHTKIHAGEIKI